MNIEDLYKKFLENKSVQTDTRKLKQGDLFFALKGPNFNGNQFVQQALDAGAAYVVIDEAEAKINEQCILVDDCLAALQALAKHHRQQFTIPFIAITGSNGKTTSKELIAAVLTAHFKTYTTQGNLNNHIGIPLTILSVGLDAAIAVIEMGANHQKEIESYCTYTLPTHGIITNTGKAHLEGFGGIEGVRKGKGELYDFIRATQGTIFIYADYDYLREMSEGIENKVWYGQNTGMVQGTVLSREPFLEVAITQGLPISSIKTKLVGDYNLPNVLCAATIGKYFGVPDDKIVDAIEAYTPSNSRSQLIQYKGNHVILDAYNANPSSMKVAVENFAAMHAAEKILLLGAMKELGEESIAEHQALVQLIDQYNWKAVVLVGGDFEKVKHNFVYLQNSAEAKEWLVKQAFHNAHILIKGSRGIMMEKIIE
jgi:UDP-N-acetylmuramoyl-tripeptide--D-alanyl-D-alanine ligase